MAETTMTVTLDLPAALLDRLTHKAHILEFAGAESYRFRERMQRQSR